MSSPKTHLVAHLLTRSAWLLVLWTLSGGPAVAASEEATGPPLVADAAVAEEVEDIGCVNPGSDTDEWIDKVEKGVYSGVCGTALWFDGLFGNLRYDQETDETFGRLGVFEKYDDRDGFETKVRLRARFALPNLSHRLRLVVGRGNEQTLLEERPEDGQGQAPSSFQTVEDDAWLLGLGYSKRSGLENGFDFGAGVRLNTPVDPYVKASYRHNFIFRGDTLLRLRETPFWRDSRGWGATTQVSLDHLATDSVLLRWNNIGTVAQDTEALDWGTDISVYKSLRERRAVSFTALLRGETGADVAIQNYGFETRYRQNIFRKWLFLDLSASLTWPRELLEEERKINPGVGLGFEMYFGPVPDVELR